MTDGDYLKLAFAAAENLSDDKHTRNGAVLVVDGEAVAMSANAFPAGVHKLPLRMHRPMKYKFIEHAERSAIYLAAADGVRTEGSTLYCPWFACTDCARAIIMAGVREVVGHVEPRNETPARWLDEIKTAEKMLREAGVSMRWVAERLGVTMLLDGRRIEC